MQRRKFAIFSRGPDLNRRGRSHMISVGCIAVLVIPINHSGTATVTCYCQFLTLIYIQQLYTRVHWTKATAWQSFPDVNLLLLPASWRNERPFRNTLFSALHTSHILSILFQGLLPCSCLEEWNSKSTIQVYSVVFQLPDCIIA